MSCRLQMPWLLWLCLSAATVRAEEPRRVDVCVYGGTPAGVAAALSAGRRGHTVLLVEPYQRIGGLYTNGLSHTDFRTFESLTGTFHEYTQRVQKYYREKYGENSPQAQGTFRGTHAEPHVNQLVLEQLLKEVPTISIMTGVCVIRSGEVEITPGECCPAQSGEGESELDTNTTFRVLGYDFQDGTGQILQVDATIWIDASYEGDLMARTGTVPFQVGREARSEHNESLAPEQADQQVQGYNFRFIMTKNPVNRVLPSAPEEYNRDDFAAVLPLLGTPQIQSVFCPSTGGLYKAHPPVLPNGKYDVNDVSRAPVRLSLPGTNDGWPNGDEKTRAGIFRKHVYHNVGLLYFLQNDPQVPANFREEARQWGWCRDEFSSTGHIPEQLYVREARRMEGNYTFTENDTNQAPGDARTVLHKDAIAMGDYGPNCHGTAHEGPRFGGRHTGEFYKKVAPYQVPYGVIVPKHCNNVLVPVACSASHVGYCALRLEPIWTSLGEAAGLAAHLSLKHRKSVREVPVDELQRLLHEQNAATIYISDVVPGHPDFASVHWWALQGGLHGLAPTPKEVGQRGEHLLGQYYHAYPDHAAELDKPLTPELWQRWVDIAAGQRLEMKDPKPATRGEFIRQAYRLHRARPAEESP